MRKSGFGLNIGLSLGNRVFALAPLTQPYFDSILITFDTTLITWDSL